MEALTGNRRLNAALSAVTAAVVGVILNLAAWLSLHVLFGQMVRVGFVNLPVLESVNWAALGIAVAAMAAIFRYRAGVIAVLAASCAAGVVLYLLGLA